MPYSLAALSLLINLIWAAAVQPFLAPDEPEHLAAVREIQRKHMLPELYFDFSSNPRGTPLPPFDDQPLTDAIDQALIGTGSNHRVSFEAVQPPLYYVVAAVVSWPFSDNVLVQLYVCRIVSAILGMLVVLFIWAAVRKISPGAPLFAVFCAATILFLPQFSFNSSNITNDVALNAIGTAALFAWFKAYREPEFDRYLILSGMLVGLAVITKLTALALIPPLALLAVLRAGSLRRFALSALGSASGFLAVAGWWFVRNIIAYGEYTGFANATQYHTSRNSFVALDITNLNMLGRFSQTTFQSSIGLFGWLDVPLDPFIYVVALAFCILFAALSLYFLFLRLRSDRPGRHALKITGVLALLSACIFAGFIAYSMTLGYQAQGRYLFLLLLPFSLLLNYGWRKLIDRRGRSILSYALPTVLLIALNIYSLLVVATHWVKA